MRESVELELMNTITTILIDVDNTLLDFEVCAELSIQEGFEEYGLEFGPEVLPTFHRVNNYFWGELEKGTLAKKDIFLNRWKTVFQELGIEADGDAFETSFIAGIARNHAPVKDALEVLQYLASKYRVCAASNSQYKQQITRLTAAGMIEYLEQVFVSDDIGAAKPSVEFFQACLQKLGDVDKEEVIMIGDSLSADIIGGINAGIQTCWYNHQKKDNPKNIKPDYYIEELKQLYEIM